MSMYIFFFALILLQFLIVVVTIVHILEVV